jgi:hypothetical protein
MAALGMQAIMWTTIGLLFGGLTERAIAGQHRFRVASGMQTALR